eukprot:16981-Heterococcus_DN1.PRE.5
MHSSTRLQLPAHLAEVQQTMLLCSMASIALPVPVPAMNIVIMIVGTRGDVQPFFGLGHKLVEDGHRVRFATHAEYESDVSAEGFEYYPIAGDPRRLSQFMVETSGRLFPNLMNKKERKRLLMQVPTCIVGAVLLLVCCCCATCTDQQCLTDASMTHSLYWYYCSYY